MQKLDKCSSEREQWNHVKFNPEDKYQREDASRSRQFKPLVHDLEKNLCIGMETINKTTITCPRCGYEKEEEMPTASCQFFYECERCKTLLKPLKGDCCVFCSYGTVNVHLCNVETTAAEYNGKYCFLRTSLRHH